MFANEMHHVDNTVHVQWNILVNQYSLILFTGYIIVFIGNILLTNRKFLNAHILIIDTAEWTLSWHCMW